jgi:hypothetical protein
MWCISFDRWAGADAGPAHAEGDNNLNSLELEREQLSIVGWNNITKNRNIPDEPQLVANAFKLNLSKCLNAFSETVQNKSINSRLSSVFLLYPTRATSLCWNKRIGSCNASRNHCGIDVHCSKLMAPISGSFPWIIQCNRIRDFFLFYFCTEGERDLLRTKMKSAGRKKNKIKYNTAGCTVSISCFPSTFSLLSLSPFSLSTARWESNYRMKSPVKDRVRYL